MIRTLTLSLYYTPAVTARLSGAVSGMLATQMGRLNKAFRDSGIPAVFKIHCAEELDIREEGAGPGERINQVIRAKGQLMEDPIIVANSL